LSHAGCARADATTMIVNRQSVTTIRPDGRTLSTLRRASQLLLLASLSLGATAAAEEAAPPEPAPPKPTSAAADAGPPERERSEPLWEIGLVGGGGWLPDYPAASQNHWRGIGLPYAIYRGDFLQVGERGLVRGLFLDLRNLEFDLSADAAFPVNSSDNRAREGMSDLDTLFEIGPKLIYKFLPRGSGQELDLSVATRAVLSTDIVNWRYQGFVVNPGLAWRDERFLNGDLSLVASLNPLFGFDGLNRYFYQVSPRDARPNRPEYNAEPGYIGTELTLGASWSPFERVRLFGGIVPGYYKGSANEDSPLYRDNFTIAVGGGLRITLFQSEQRVPR
jgi:MipA family protein